MMKAIIITLIVGVAAGLAYIRMAPFDKSKWHNHPDTFLKGAITETGGYRLTLAVKNARQAMERMHEIATTHPRTLRVAGLFEDGLVTYQTRSFLFGFPDYTTIAAGTDEEGAPMIHIHGRLRFGSSDLGVNKARISGWVADFGADD